MKGRKLLLAFSINKNAYYLPGGKIDTGETSQTALTREIMEELNIRLDPRELEFYTHITAPAFGEKEGTVMEQDCYRLDLAQMPDPGAEIKTVRYFDSSAYSLEPDQVPGVVLLIHQLKLDNLID